MKLSSEDIAEAKRNYQSSSERDEIRNWFLARRAERTKPKTYSCVNQWRSFKSFGDKFAKLCVSLGLNCSEDARALVFDSLLRDPAPSREEFHENFFNSVSLFDGQARARVLNSRESYCSIASRLQHCAETVLPASGAFDFLRSLLIEDPQMLLEDFSERLAEFTS